MGSLAWLWGSVSPNSSDLLGDRGSALLRLLGFDCGPGRAFLNAGSGVPSWVSSDSFAWFLTRPCPTSNMYPRGSNFCSQCEAFRCASNFRTSSCIMPSHQSTPELPRYANRCPHHHCTPSHPKTKGTGSSLSSQESTVHSSAWDLVAVCVLAMLPL